MKQLVFRETGPLEYQLKESLNVLKTNLDFCGDDIKVVMITSCGEIEGKSSTAMNLARVEAEDGKRVLYLDMDMRKSSLASWLKLRRGEKLEGLSHYLSGQASINDVIYYTNISNMFVLPAGPFPPNPPGLIGSDKFTKGIELVRTNFDLVIIDSPPVGMVIDAAVASSACDGAILLLESGYVSCKAAIEVKKQLEIAGCNILGAVINKMPNSGNKYYKGYYKKYYGKE